MPWVCIFRDTAQTAAEALWCHSMRFQRLPAQPFCSIEVLVIPDFGLELFDPFADGYQFVFQVSRLILKRFDLLLFCY